jgi:hypothetical protein
MQRGRYRRVLGKNSSGGYFGKTPGVYFGKIEKNAPRSPPCRHVATHRRPSNELVHHVHSRLIYHQKVRDLSFLMVYRFATRRQIEEKF